MSRVLKVLVRSDQQADVAGSDEVIEHYDAFVVLEVSESRANALAKDHSVEDITDQYAIPVGDVLEQRFDTANNVGVVSVTAPAAGAWTIDVIGANVPEGPQRFALAVLGPLGHRPSAKEP